MENRQQKTTDPQQVDVIVIGSGAAGLTAALVAAIEGLDVVVFEKSAAAGGTTATSGGSLWAPGASQILRKTPDVGIDRARNYLLGELGEWVRHDHLEAFLAASPEAIDYLAEHSDVQFAHATNPDYHADQPFGSATGHAITALPFDGRLLGEDFARLKPPRDVFMVMGGMMVGRREIPMLVRPFSSLSNFRRTLALLARQALDRLRYPRGTRLLIGNALVARYLYSLRKRGVPIEYETRLVELRQENGRVVGAIVETADGQRREVRARRGVVLATGGAAHSLSLRAELMTAHPHAHSMADEGNTGDGITLARAVGAAVDDTIPNPAFWSPASIRQGADGKQTLWVHGHMDRGKPGLMAVDASGRRFVNEADSYHDFVVAMYGARKRAIPAYLVCDHRFIRKYGFGLVRPLISRIAPFVRDGYLIRADTIDELARRIGVDAAALRETVNTYNDDARKGVDSEFGRGSKIFNRFNGDPEHGPNPCMSPIENAPYYALKVVPCSIGTTVGLATDVDGRVLGCDGAPLDGLYACGNDVTSVFRGFYPGPGATLGPAVVFAYRAARRLAADE